MSNPTYIILVCIAGIALVLYLINDAMTDHGTSIVREIKRMWLLHNINGWQRDIEQIQAQRNNDFRAEAAIQREIINAKSQLRDLV